MNKRIYLYIYLAAVVLLFPFTFVACEKEQQQAVVAPELSFLVGSTDEYQTVNVTKASPYVEKTDIADCKVAVYNGKTTVFDWVKATKVDIDGHRYLKPAKTFLWTGVARHFYAFAPYATYGSTELSELTVTSASGGTYKAKFSYFLPASVTAPKQYDILFGHYYGKGEGEIVDGVQTLEAPMSFYHPLAAVKVCAANSISSVSDTKVNFVMLSDFYSKGSCVVDGSAETPVFTWTLSSAGEVAKYKTNFSSPVTPAKGVQIGGDSQTFMIIPQTPGLGSLLVISLTHDGITERYGKYMNTFTFEAGKMYVFQVGIDGIKTKAEGSVDSDESFDWDFIEAE